MIHDKQNFEQKVEHRLLRAPKKRRGCPSRVPRGWRGGSPKPIPAGSVFGEGTPPFGGKGKPRGKTTLGGPTPKTSPMEQWKPTVRAMSRASQFKESTSPKPSQVVVWVCNHTDKNLSIPKPSHGLGS